jgi:hypothetical protein
MKGHLTYLIEGNLACLRSRLNDHRAFASIDGKPTDIRTDDGFGIIVENYVETRLSYAIRPGEKQKI